MNYDQLKLFQTWAIIALFSDDSLAEFLALKGGAALDLIYKLNTRASIDIDISLEKDFQQNQLPEIHKKLARSFSDTFAEHGYTIFDFQFERRPLKQSIERDAFWGGYQITFKIYRTDLFQNVSQDLEKARRQAEVVGKHEGRKFTVDISKYEYCKGKQEMDLDGFSIYVYTPHMIIYEKLRAICQQFPEYFINKGRFKSSRPRDFYDIYTIMQKLDISFDELNLTMLHDFFQIKRVDLSLLNLIPKYKNDITAGLPALIDTLTPQARTDFNFEQYFQFVLAGIQRLLKQPTSLT